MEIEQFDGAVVLAYNRHVHTLADVLCHCLEHRPGITRFTHPYEIAAGRARDYVIVLSRADLAGVVKVIRSAGWTSSLVVHIDALSVIRNMDYARLYPGVRVIGIEDARLAGKSAGTVEALLFKAIAAGLSTPSFHSWRSDLPLN